MRMQALCRLCRFGAALAGPVPRMSASAPPAPHMPVCVQVVFTRQYDQLAAVLPQGPAERLLEVLMASLEVRVRACVCS